MLEFRKERRGFETGNMEVDLRAMKDEFKQDFPEYDLTEHTQQNHLWMFGKNEEFSVPL